MPIDEKMRLDIRQWFTEHMNPEMAHAMMEAMPGIDYEELATRTDVADTRRALRRDIGDLRTELRGEMADLRTELRGEMADLRTELRGEMADLRTELRGEMNDLCNGMKDLRRDIDVRMEQAFAQQLKWLVGTQFAAVGVLGGIIGLVAAVT